MTVRHDPQRLAAARRGVGMVRRRGGQDSLLAFAHLYLPRYFSLPCSSMHHELAGLLEEASRRRSARLAIAAPRGHAKSTLIGTAYVLWSLCYGREPYIVLVSNTSDQACDLLSHVKRELEGNHRLRDDFPGVCEDAGSRPGPPRWRKDEIITRSDAKVTALGAGSKIRGRKHRQHRPSLIVLDDVENEAEVRSADQREQMLGWFNQAVAKAGDGATNLIAAGTILHYDALLSRLTDPDKSPGWTGRVYRAVRAWSAHPELWERWEALDNGLEEYEGLTGPDAAQSFYMANQEAMLSGTEVLWPELEPYPKLMEMRLREGRASFDCEKQNQPTNPEDCYFRDSDLVYWDDQYPDAAALLGTRGPGDLVYGACDPSLGKAGRHRDDTAIVTLLRREKILYVLDADIRKRKPDQIIEDLMEYHRLRSFSRLAVESNQFQEFLADEARRRAGLRGVRLPVWNIRQGTDKLGRIQSLQPLISSGMIRFSRRHALLLEQLRQFPHAAHDDGPDALEMAVQAAHEIIMPKKGRIFVAPSNPDLMMP